MTEEPVTFDCAGDRLIGVLHRGADDADVGVVFVIGGPQYRVGSHRQFVLMARYLSAAGIPVMRFDVRGMGDSEGKPRPFTALDVDINAAIDHFTTALPRLAKVVLAGLCDAASANLIYGHRDLRVRGLILMNPWVRTTQGEARTYLRHYYVQRLLQKAFWIKLLTGKFTPLASLADLIQSIRAARSSTARVSTKEHPDVPFVEQMLVGLMNFQHPILVIISGRDLTAQEFVDLGKIDKRWQMALQQSRSVMREFGAADHTMSTRADLDSISRCCVDWLSRNM